MRQPSITLRYPASTDKRIEAAARAAGTSKYKAACEALTLGANLMAGAEPKSDESTLPDSEASLARIDALDRLAHRILWVSCAAYIFARHSAMRSESQLPKLHQELTDAVMAAYERQLNLAKGEVP